MGVSTNILRRILAVAVLGLLAPGPVCLGAEPTPTPSSSYSAEALKAAYLLNFVKFTEWPFDRVNAGRMPIVIGVLGSKEIEDFLWKLSEGHEYHGRPLKVRRMIAFHDASECDVLYLDPESVSGGSGFSAHEWLRSVRGANVLTVSHLPGFLESGGIINFYTEGSNLRFEINVSNALTADLKLSSRLLALSKPENKAASRKGVGAP